MTVYCVSDGNGNLKVGYTSRKDGAQGRVKSLQTSCPSQLVIVAVNEDAGRSTELAIHKALSGTETGGGREWFSDTDEARRFIVDALNNAVPDPVVASVPQDVVPVDDDLDCFCEVSEMTVRDALCLVGLEECLDIHGKYPWEWSDDFFDGTCGHEFSVYCGDGVKPISPTEFRNEMLRDVIDNDCNEQSSVATRRVVSIIATDLFSQKMSDCCDCIQTFIAKTDNGILFVAVTSPDVPDSELQEIAEQVYSTWFWTVDAFGTQLFAMSIPSSRKPLEVPYGFGWR